MSLDRPRRGRRSLTSASFAASDAARFQMAGRANQPQLPCSNWTLTPFSGLLSAAVQTWETPADIVLVDQEVRQIVPSRGAATLGATAHQHSGTTCSSGSTKASIECRDDRGVPVLAAYRCITLTPDVRWGLVVKIDRAEVFANLWKRVLYSVLVGLGGLLSAGILALWLARKISLPVEDLRTDRSGDSVRKPGSTVHRARQQ